MRVTPGSASALADGLRAGVLAGVDRAAEARLGDDRVGAREVAGREAGLVAAHVEPDEVGVRVLDRAPRDRLGRLDPEVPDAAREDAALDAVRGPGVVDAAGDAVPVLVVGEADGRGVVGRRDELDVDGALRRARRRGSPP